MTCSNCEEFHEPRPIRVPADLTAAILSLQAAVADNRLAVLPVHSIHAGADFSTLEIHGPWEDLIQNAFQCVRCGQRYLLTAETYHGRGGSLKAVSHV
ncbi:hypothetical protein N7E02_21620 [Aliirhizobium terrae]|uniref:hypothetical protein n=1 Tax=Terrirhizobium terrae TaxID=2926709 RepID=UPI002577D2C6|nr:hypothetical protein [Rhizobium sp. CC-CFT758]WJH39410.1 hypothetical protein N7E02_21620 [Rhizobium sp. CC-CFT758]